MHHDWCGITSSEIKLFKIELLTDSFKLILPILELCTLLYGNMDIRCLIIFLLELDCI